MSGKRHHYLPQFLLRRFAEKDGDRAGLVWRADLSRERVLRVAPKHEAAKRHYYGLPPESGLPPEFAERVIGIVESNAATAIQRLERGEKLSFDDRHYIALLLALQHRRTPAGRRDLRFMDEMLAKLDAELRTSDTEHVRGVLSSDGRSPTDEEISEWQEQTLRELAEGQLIIESTPDREVALMFMALDRTGPMLVEQFDWMFLDIETDVGEVVLPDVGVTLLDPTPPFEESGTGFASSLNAETVLHLSPQLVLLIRPGEGYGYRQEAAPSDIEKLNLRAVACSDRCIYGRTRELVEGVLDLAGDDPQRVESLRPRPPRMWITESHEGEPEAGVHEFVGYSRGGTATRRFHVSREGIEEARRNAYRTRPAA